MRFYDIIYLRKNFKINKNNLKGEKMKKFKIGLVSRLLIAIVLGIGAGLVLPEPIIRIAVTFSGLFSKYLTFIIPLMIIGFVVIGIADLTQGAGKLLGITTLIAYTSTVVAGSLAYIMASTVFPHIIDGSVLIKIGNPEENILKSFFEISLPPLLDVTSAVVFSFSNKLVTNNRISKR